MPHCNPHDTLNQPNGIQLTPLPAALGCPLPSDSIYASSVVSSTPTHGLPVKAAAPRSARVPMHTHPLFPELPQYGPPTLLRRLQSLGYRLSSTVLSLTFLGAITVGALVTGIPDAVRRLVAFLTLRDPDVDRPFYAEERRRQKLRQDAARDWDLQKKQQPKKKKKQLEAQDPSEDVGDYRGNDTNTGRAYTPTAGGRDPLTRDVGHYARRVGLDVEEFQVQTEDGFLLDLWHVYDPAEYTPLPAAQRGPRGPTLWFEELDDAEREARQQQMLAERLEAGEQQRKPKFPVLLVHGLLQSAGVYCVSDEDSLAFYLCKSGYDVWLGNNRCGFRPRHVSLPTSDPRMWCWNIRQMGVLDLPALVSRVLRQTRFARLGLVCHSQGTTQTLVALAKEQRPALGRCLTVFCALAPAAYAGSLIGRLHFQFMRVISPRVFRLVFGIHSFIPVMMQAHALLPGRLYGWLGYRVFSFLFSWSDTRWDRGLRDRMFHFAPVYISAEAMCWWLGRNGFARHKCILATKEEWRAEEEEEERWRAEEAEARQGGIVDSHAQTPRRTHSHPHHYPHGARAWYDEQVPPFALWVCGNDDLVDGRKLLRRLLPTAAYSALIEGRCPVLSWDRSSKADRSRSEPHVRVVHAKIVAEYEHLDVVLAVDAVDQVFSEVREVLWKTCSAREDCRVPVGCEAVPQWVDEVAVGADGRAGVTGDRLGTQGTQDTQDTQGTRETEEADSSSSSESSDSESLGEAEEADTAAGEQE